MQKGRNVNMLKGVGISIRDEQGNMKGPEEIIDALWKKICRDYSGAYGSAKSPSEREIQIGFQQGNSMDQLVQNMFGDDPLIYMTIKNGLIYKAKSGGGAITKEDVTKFGMTTDAANTFAMKQALGTQQLGQVSNFGAGAYNITQMGLNAITFGLNAEDAIGGPTGGPLKILNGVAAVMQTLGGAAGGAGSMFMNWLMKALGLQGKATGGSVNDEQPYIVGEKGPELFIPKTDGVIIPNDLGPFRHKGGGVLAKGHNHGWGKTPLAESAVKNILSQAGFTGQALEDALQIAQGESGYNPLAFNGDTSTGDTSYGLMQINMLGNLGPGRRKWFGLKSDEDLYNPLVNAKAAYALYKSKGYRFDRDWVTQSKKLASKGVPGGDSSSTASSSSSSSSSADTDSAVLDEKGIAAITKYLGKDVSDSYKQYLKTGEIGNISLAGLMGGGAAATGLASTLGSAITNNYGGVTFNMNVLGGDPESLKSVFQGWYEKLRTGTGVSSQ
jgi:SLT domain-containing protein